MGHKKFLVRNCQKSKAYPLANFGRKISAYAYCVHGYEHPLAPELREHMDMAQQIRTINEKMPYREITIDEVKCSIKATKTGKAAGPDKLKPEFFKAMSN